MKKLTHDLVMDILTFMKKILLTIIMRILEPSILIILIATSCTPPEKETIGYASFSVENDGEFEWLRGNTVNGKPHGYWIQQNRYGVETRKALFSNGEIIKLKITRKDGSPKWACYLKNGKPHGKYEYRYFMTAMAHIYGQFENGKKVGKWDYYWFDKSPWYTIDFGNGTLSSVDTIYQNHHSKLDYENYIKGLRPERIEGEIDLVNFNISLLEKRRLSLEETMTSLADSSKIVNPMFKDY